MFLNTDSYIFYNKIDESQITSNIHNGNKHNSTFTYQQKMYYWVQQNVLSTKNVLLGTFGYISTKNVLYQQKMYYFLLI